MGTSLEQLSATYAHLLPDSADRARAAMDAYLVNRRENSFWQSVESGAGRSSKR